MLLTIRARRARLRQLLHLVLNLLLLIRELLRLAHRVIQIAAAASVLFLVDEAARVLKIAQRLLRVAISLLTVRGSTTHLARRILKAARRIGEVLIVLLTREALELVRFVLGLLREIALALAALRSRLTHASETVGLRARAIVLLLLPRRELPQLLGGFVDLIVGLLLLPLLLPALDRLVLVSDFVFLKLENVREILGVGLVAASAAAATLLLAHLNLDVTEHRLGALQLLQRTLLRPERRARRTGAELLLGGVHHRPGLLEHLGDALPVAVARGDAALFQLVR